MNARSALLVRLLDERHGLTIAEDIARDDISDHVDYVATMMRIGRQAAKYYVTDQVISDMADRIASAVRQHQDALRQGDVADLDARRQLRG
jgi:hypothetical protein